MSHVVRTAEFITRLADKGYTKKDSITIVNDVLDVIYEALIDGDDVSIVGFGAFRIYETSPKRIRNVNTREICVTRPRKAVRFVPGKALRRAASGELLLQMAGEEE